jgi:hypothetical protein
MRHLNAPKLASFGDELVTSFGSTQRANEKRKLTIRRFFQQLRLAESSFDLFNLLKRFGPYQQTGKHAAAVPLGRGSAQHGT